MNKILKNFCLLLLGTLLLTQCCKDDDANSDSLPQDDNGSIVFWTPNLVAHGGYVEVTINGLTRQIVTNWMTPPPNCLSTNGVAYFYLAPGQHTYTTKDFFGFTSSGTATVVSGNCNKHRVD